MEDLWSDIARLLQAMETGKQGLSPAEEMEKAEAGWEEEMVRRNRLANLGLPSEEKQAVERFEDGVAAVGQLERSRVPTPRTFFSRTGQWSDMELGAAVQQGLWEGYSLALQPAHLSKERWKALLGEKKGGSCLIPSIPLGGGNVAHQQKVTWALGKAREAMEEEPHPLLSIRRGLVMQEAFVSPELEGRVWSRRGGSGLARGGWHLGGERLGSSAPG